VFVPCAVALRPPQWLSLARTVGHTKASMAGITGRRRTSSPSCIEQWLVQEPLSVM
jgi:hypothetical protein